MSSITHRNGKLTKVKREELFQASNLAVLIANLAGDIADPEKRMQPTPVGPRASISDTAKLIQIYAENISDDLAGFDRIPEDD